jgi:hypothetical protein
MEYDKLCEIDKDIEHTNEYLRDIRALLIEIRDLLKPKQTTVAPSQCICGGEPHASHCPMCPDPFLRGLL